MSTDTFVQVAPDSTGKKIRNFLNTLLGNDVYQQVVTVAKSDGTVLDDLSRSSVGQPVTGTFFQATQPVSAAALPLPTGASTEVTLALIKAKTDNLDVLLSTRTKPADSQHVTLDAGAAVIGHVVTDTGSTTAVSNFPATQPISAAALPLPTGAATEATLGLIDTAILAQARLVDTQPVSVASLPLPAGAALDATAQTNWDTLIQLVRFQNALLRSMSLQLGMLTAPNHQIEDLAPFITAEVLQ